ncbi:other/FunK1 protein kinase [Coprinopsis cinerea AmutBmut pab1-1]|nr:other/FunK1 protein kinase [Coprinopsis cinerea AmutBmut pab1-1]
MVSRRSLRSAARNAPNMNPITPTRTRRNRVASSPGTSERATMHFTDEISPLQFVQPKGLGLYPMRPMHEAWERDSGFVNTLLECPVNMADVYEYLAYTELWDSNRCVWPILEDARTRQEYVSAFHTIISDILRHFQLDRKDSGYRTAWITSFEHHIDKEAVEIRLNKDSMRVSDVEAQDKRRHDEGFFGKDSYPIPNICVTGTGPCFRSADTAYHFTPSYERSFYFCEVLENLASPPLFMQTELLEPFARYIFYTQPNRTFFRLLTLSHSGHYRLFHFDRSGVLLTPETPLNVQGNLENAIDFVSAILSLTPHNNTARTLKAAGFDEYIFWKDENIVSNPIRQGYIIISQKEKDNARREIPFNQRMLPLLSDTPVSIEPGVAGRGLVRWLAQDEDRNATVVEDWWAEPDPRGNPQATAPEISTSDFRGRENPNETHQRFRNLIKFRRELPAEEAQYILARY